MSYSIQEGVEDAKRRLKAEEAIAEKFPDARLGDLASNRSVWLSESACPHVTDIELVVGAKNDIYIYPYLTVEGMRVYARGNWDMTHYTWLEAIKKHPDAYKILVDIARK